MAKILAHLDPPSCCAVNRCCGDHCCDWDDCDCGDCVVCGGTLPVAFEPAEVLVRTQQRAAERLQHTEFARQVAVAAVQKLQPPPPPTPAALPQPEPEEHLSTLSSAQTWLREQTEQEKLLLQAMAAATTQREELRASIANLQAQVEKLRLVAAAAAEDYAAAQRRLETAGRQVDFYVSFVGAALQNEMGDDDSDVKDAVDIDHIHLEPVIPLLTESELDRMAFELATQHYTVVDGAVPLDVCRQLRSGLDAAFTASLGVSEVKGEDPEPPDSALPRFERGLIAGGRSGRTTKLDAPHVRNDYVCWLKGNEQQIACLKPTVAFVDNIVCHLLGERVPELSVRVLYRQSCMAACYPGNGAHYNRHIDNPNQNGRHVTAIVYLNEDWTPDQGGELKLHLETPQLVAPLMGRLLVFFSDQRVPHEVLPAHTRRFSLTTWYFDLEAHADAVACAEPTTPEGDSVRRIAGPPT